MKTSSFIILLLYSTICIAGAPNIIDSILFSYKNDAFLPQSIIEEQYKSDTREWINLNKTEFKYNKSDSLIEESSYQWHAGKKIWRKKQKFTYTYCEFGMNSKTIWQGNDANEWVPTTYVNLTYLEKNKLDSIYDYLWNTVLQTWDLNKKTLFSYTTTEKIAVNYKRIDDSTFEKTKRIIYYYGAFGVLTEYKTEIWSKEDSLWDQNTLTKYLRPPHSSSYVIEFYNFKDDPLTIYEKKYAESFEYNKQDNLVRYEDKHKLHNKDIWQNYRQITYNYKEGKLTSSVQMICLLEDIWENDKICNFIYENDTLREYLMLQFSDITNNYQAEEKQEYTYNKNHCIEQTIESLYNIPLKIYVPDKRKTYTYTNSNQYIPDKDSSVESHNVNKSTLNIHPTIAKDLLYLENTGMCIEQATILNVSGIRTMYISLSEGVVDISPLANGIYYISLMCNGEITNIPFIKY